MTSDSRSHQVRTGRGDLHPCLLRVRPDRHEHGNSDAEVDQWWLACGIPHRKPTELVNTRDGRVVISCDLRTPVVDVHAVYDTLGSGGKRDEYRVHPKPYIRDDDRGGDADVIPAARVQMLYLPGPTHPAHGERRILGLDAVAVGPHCLRYRHLSIALSTCTAAEGWQSLIASPDRLPRDTGLVESSGIRSDQGATA